MSIRIKLMMGYGLDNVQSNNGVITDPRINPNGWLISEEDYLWSFNEFTDRVRDEVATTKTFGQDFDKLDKVNYLTYCNTKLEIHNCVIYDGEMGLDNVLLLIPPTMVHKWYRHDDDLDYYLAANGICSTQMSWYRISNTNFYPYSGFIDSKTGERMVNPYSDMIREIYKEDKSYQLKGKLWLEELGCSTTDEIRQRYKHVIPSTLKSFINYTQLFNDDNTIYDLKPMLYGFWS